MMNDETSPKPSSSDRAFRAFQKKIEADEALSDEFKAAINGDLASQPPIKTTLLRTCLAEGLKS
jgi:hypothetical protein